VTLASSPLIQVIPGLMIWTIFCFASVFFLLRWLAFGRIRAIIAERRERIRQSIDEADNARAEAHRLIEGTAP